ncbi:hypothetical protein SEVIR_2G280600v4 [Setaria viridis]|uniref:Uncharacterized protein n=1 Tax=Setaria viridis TaxID=4556 RepID=A0A4V6DBN9_SETVI|nr:hypothetical protein SEVIR_2G280600v2 [Setaria viridis]
MPGLMRNSRSLVNLLDKKFHQLPTSKMMKISKSAPNLVKKAVTSFKSKTDALRTKLMILASLRRRMAMVCAMSRQIHALVASGGQEKKARVEHSSKALALGMATATSEEPAGDDGGRAHLGMFEVAMYEEGYHGYPEWTNSLFDDDNIYSDDEDVQDDDEHDDLDVVDAFDDEPSVIEIIRSNREAEGLEFMEDDIDEACDMFIRRCRSRMNLSF